MGHNGENRPTLKVIPAKLHRTEIARIPTVCRPPRPSFFSILHFWPNLHISLCTYLLLYLVPLPQISAIRRPIVTKFCGRNQDLFICNRPQNDRFREIFRGTSGPPKVNRFSSKVIFPEFLYFFPFNWFRWIFFGRLLGPIASNAEDRILKFKPEVPQKNSPKLGFFQKTRPFLHRLTPNCVGLLWVTLGEKLPGGNILGCIPDFLQIFENFWT